MGQLRRAIIPIAATIVLVNPSAAKVFKSQVLKVESPAIVERTFGTVGTNDRISARATIAVPPIDIPDCLSRNPTGFFTGVRLAG